MKMSKKKIEFFNSGSTKNFTVLAVGIAES